MSETIHPYGELSEKDKKMMSLTQNESKENEPMTLSTKILDNSVVSSSLSLAEQNILVKFEELKDYFDWLDSPSRQADLVRKASLLTVNNLPTTNHEKWQKLSQEDHIYSLGETIKQEVNTCFHRATFFNSLMNHANIPSVELGGRVIETEKNELSKDEKIAPLFSRESLGLEEGDFEEAHVWNIILENGQNYLVDTAFLVDNKPLITKVDFDNETRNTFRIDLGNGKFRYYLSSDAVKVNETSI